MYATKRRRRSLKGSNSKLCLQKGVYEASHGPSNGINNGPGGGGGGGSLKSNPSKRHRERLNSELERIAALLPFEANILSKLDKLSILRLSVSYLRIKSYFQAIQLREQTYGGYDGTMGHKTASDHFSLDPSLTRTESVLKALNGFVLVLTTQGEVFFASSNIEEFLGFHQSDVIHQSVYELIHSEDRMELQKQLSWLGSPQTTAGSRISSHDPFLADNFQHLERCLTARFRCLLDNTSGFLRLEIRGRIGVLHGQNFHSVGDAPPGLLAICTPFGPATLPDNLPKESVFKSKLKLDLTIINIDTKGKDLLGYALEENPSTCRSFYNCLHPDDILYAASAHRELGKTNSCVMYAHRMLRKQSSGPTNSQWQWVQTTMKIIPKNGKPDHVSAAHRPLSDEEGKDLMSKRASITKLCDLDPDASLSMSHLSERTPGHGIEDGLCAPIKTAKAPKKKASPNHNRENHHNQPYTPPLPIVASRRRKSSFSTENILARNVNADLSQYTPAYHTETSLNYCTQNPYSAAIFLPATDQCSLLPYSSQYGPTAGFYSTTALPVSESVLSGSHTANGTAYDIYAAAAYGATPDVLPSQGDYLKSYYKGMDSHSSSGYNSDTLSRMTSSHHRQSVLVWNANSRADAALGFKNSWGDGSRSNSYTLTAPSSASAFSTTADNRQNGSQSLSGQRSLDLESNKAGHANDAGMVAALKTTSLMQNHNFSICEATNTMLETAG